MPEWNQLFTDDEFRWKVPHELVIRAAEIMTRRGGFSRVLDLGCGAGRHVVYLAGEGFDVYGMDAAANGLAHARHWLDERGLSANLLLADMIALPYADAFFDAVISTYVIFHQSWAGMLTSMAETRRVLRVGGLALFTLNSRFSYRYGLGEEIEPHTFIGPEGDDAGAPHHFCDLAEVAALFAGFKVSEVTLQENYDDHGREHHQWAVWAERLPGEAWYGGTNST